MRYKYQQHFTNQAGNVVSSGTVTVFNANTTVLATVYSTSGSTGSISGSAITTGTDGFFNFWVDTKDYSSPAARFKTILSKTNFTSKTYDDVLISPNIREVYPEMFGAIGNGVADDTTALQAAINEAKTVKGIVIVSPNTAYRITAEVNYSGITIRGANRVYSKIFIDYAGLGLHANGAGSDQSVLENLTIGGTLSFDWANSPVAGKIGVHIESLHNHIIRNCHFFALDTGIKITGGGYYGITESNLFRRNNISVHLLSDGTGPPNEQNILYNQFDVYPVSVGGRGTTIGIKSEGILGTGIVGLKVIGNGLENMNTAIQFIYTSNSTLISNHPENNGTNYTFSNAGGIFEIGTLTVPTTFSILGSNANFKINTPTVTQEEPSTGNNNLYRFSRNSTVLSQIGLNSNNAFVIQANTQIIKMSADGFANTHLQINTNGNIGVNSTAPTSKLHVVGLPVYATNSSALGGGLTAGAFYRSGANPDTVRVVHAAT